MEQKNLIYIRPIVCLKFTLSKKNEYIRLEKNIGYNVFGLQYGFKSELLEIKSADQVDLVSDIIVPLDASQNRFFCFTSNLYSSNLNVMFVTFKITVLNKCFHYPKLI